MNSHGDQKDRENEEARNEYIRWLTKTDRELTEAEEKPYCPLKPRVTRENLWNL